VKTLPSSSAPLPPPVSISVSADASEDHQRRNSEEGEPPVVEPEEEEGIEGIVIEQENRQLDSTSVKDYPPICQDAAQMNISFSFSKFFQDSLSFSSAASASAYGSTTTGAVLTPSSEHLLRLCNDSGSCKVQLLRSIGKWSVGTNKTECSILNCYVESIRTAHRFIYIENQFFISRSLSFDNTISPDSSPLTTDSIQNPIALALIDRILLAHSLKESFKVIILLPIHPPGDVISSRSKGKILMYYQYLSLNRGPFSFFEQLRKRGPADLNPLDYIGFYSLRNWGIMNNKVVTEQVYIHSKLMIIDDRILLIGSANMNDRSMLGYRDSEIVLRIEDTNHINSLMNGQVHSVGFMPFMVRTRLMRQHLGNPINIGKTIVVFLFLFSLMLQLLCVPFFLVFSLHCSRFYSFSLVFFTFLLLLLCVPL
jgi:phosphatidylserine/phosphatidylglycerophosphate/cardiolipin synthase-like enzyme